MIDDNVALSEAPADATSDADAFDAGVAQADAEDSQKDAAAYAKELALAKKWLNRIKKARAFDENIRKQYAINRRYLSGETGRFEVSVPLAPSYTEILCSILYARNPDLDVQPAPSTSPPPMASIIEMAREQIINDADTHLHMEAAGIEAERTAQEAFDNAGKDYVLRHASGDTTAQPPPPLPEAGVLGEKAAQAWLNKTIKDTAQELMKPYRRALEDAKQFGKTISIVVADAWLHAKLKRKAKKQLRSTLVHGAGYLKVTWQDRAGNDPIQAPHNDEKQSLDRMAATVEKIDKDTSATTLGDAEQATLEAQDVGLQSPKQSLHRGMAFDFLPVQDVQIDTGTASLEDYLEARWIAHRFIRSASQAKIDFPDVKDKIDNAQKYYQEKPRDPEVKLDSGGAISDVDANEAEIFRTNANSGTTSDNDDPNICGWEVWSRDDNVIYTVIEGIDCFARQPYAPNVPTTRFYPLFQLAIHWLDGKRHPDSLIARTAQLLDEVNATHSDARTHRRRAIPKTIGNSAMIDKENVKKIEGGTSNEIVMVDLPNPKVDINRIFKNFDYPQFDPKLYDDSKSKAELETAWGIQEALASSIQTAKTATEAEIQQTGTNARTGYQRDEIDETLDDLAQYTAEILVQKYTHAEVVEIAGPWAFWPGPGDDGATGISLDKMHSLITVKIKAGSSGKPNSSAQQQAWATTMPLLNSSITEIGQLRGASQQDMADCKEELVSETLARAGEGLDSSRFIPQVPSQAPGEQPDPQAQPTMQGPQPNVRQPPHPMPATLPAPNGQGLPVPHRGHITTHNRPPAALNEPGQQP